MNVAEPPAGERNAANEPGRAGTDAGLVEGATGGGPERLIVLTDDEAAGMSEVDFKQAVRAGRAKAPQMGALASRVHESKPVL